MAEPDAWINDDNGHHPTEHALIIALGGGRHCEDLGPDATGDDSHGLDTYRCSRTYGHEHTPGHEKHAHIGVKYERLTALASWPGVEPITDAELD